MIAGLLAVPYLAGYAASPTIAAIVWETGGYDLVLLLAVAASSIGLLALLAAWRSAFSRQRSPGA